jgi:hypothetical protein
MTTFMEQKNKTTIQWVAESISKAKSLEEIVLIINNAAYLEYQQLADAYDAGYLDGTSHRSTSAERYYTDTYGRTTTTTKDDL